MKGALLERDRAEFPVDDRKPAGQAASTGRFAKAGRWSKLQAEQALARKKLQKPARGGRHRIQRQKFYLIPSPAVEKRPGLAGIALA
jgi:hypothetical protein